MLKVDGSVSAYTGDRAYKPLNWTSALCIFTVTEADEVAQKVGASSPRLIRSRFDDTLWITLDRMFLDVDHSFGAGPELQKDGVEVHLQTLLAEHPATFGEGWQVIKHEFYTPIGPVNLLLRDAGGTHFAVKVKRRDEVDGVGQLTRYLELMNRDPQLALVKGIFAAQQTRSQAATLAADQGIVCQLLGYNALWGMNNSEGRPF